MDENYGKLAYEFAGVALKNQVLKSARGYYIGTLDPENGLVSCESEEYWKSKENAMQVLDANSWTQRREP